MLLSWLVLTNHCALALVQAQAVAAKAAACCHKTTPPVGSAPCHEATPCCKTVKAEPTANEGAKLTAPLLLLPVMAVLEWLAAPVCAEVEQAVWEHGPPRVISFAEAVLQRSLRSHAPPFAA